MVYSTCSFNPVENEAVISAALNLNPGSFFPHFFPLSDFVPKFSHPLSHAAFQILDVSDRYPLLKRSPGLTTWKAATGKETMSIYDTHQDFLNDEDQTVEIKEKVPKTYWPKGNEKELGLEKWFICLI